MIKNLIKNANIYEEYKKIWFKSTELSSSFLIEHNLKPQGLKNLYTKYREIEDICDFCVALSVALCLYCFMILSLVVINSFPLILGFWVSLCFIANIIIARTNLREKCNSIKFKCQLILGLMSIVISTILWFSYNPELLSILRH